MRGFIFIVSIFFMTSLALATSPAEVIAKAHKAASDQPKSKNFYNAAMVFNWQPNRVYQVYTRPDRITDISLEHQENLISVLGGDSQRWSITDSSSGQGPLSKKHVLVRPHQLGLSSNLIITTDRRVYHLELHSSAQIPYQAIVSWDYPKSSLIISKPLPPPRSEKAKPTTPLSGLMQKQLNFNYHFVASERPRWMPRRVFDDGHKTYVEFPAEMQDSEAPILYGLSDAKEHEIINYRRYKNFYIVDHLIDLSELTIGGKKNLRVGIEREGV